MIDPGHQAFLILGNPGGSGVTDHIEMAPPMVLMNVALELLRMGRIECNVHHRGIRQTSLQRHR